MIKTKIIYISIAVVLAVLLVFFGYFLGQRKVSETGVEKANISTPADLGAGQEGEIMVKDEKTGEEVPLISATMPAAIFSTTGIITEIQKDKIILRGDGYNFADNLPRTIAALITDSTITISKNQTSRYLGEKGLKYLKAGMEILIGSQENIRGKVEFQVKTINIL